MQSCQLILWRFGQEENKKERNDETKILRGKKKVSVSGCLRSGTPWLSNGSAEEFIGSGVMGHPNS